MCCRIGDSEKARISRIKNDKSASVLEFRGLRLALYGYPELDPIIRRVDEILLRPKVSLGGLHGLMPKQHLDLLQFSTSRPA